MSYRVVFSPEAEEQLVALYGYIAAAASPDIAARYTEAIVSYCESLNAFPYRGAMRDDVRPGLRITNYKKRTVIAFEVNTEQVSIDFRCERITAKKASLDQLKLVHSPTYTTFFAVSPTACLKMEPSQLPVKSFVQV